MQKSILENVQLGQLIDSATSQTLFKAKISKFEEISDLVTRNQSRVSFLMNQLKEKLNKKSAIKTQIYTIELIEYLSCHNQELLKEFNKKSFLKFINEIFNQKNATSFLKERTLFLVQFWATDSKFKDCKNFQWYFKLLKSKNIPFPNQKLSQFQNNSNTTTKITIVNENKLSPRGQKLYKDLKVVVDNVKVGNDLVTCKNKQAAYDVLKTVDKMKQKILKLLDRLKAANEEFLYEFCEAVLKDIYNFKKRLQNLKDKQHIVPISNFQQQVIEKFFNAQFQTINQSQDVVDFLNLDVSSQQEQIQSQQDIEQNEQNFDFIQSQQKMPQNNLEQKNIDQQKNNQNNYDKYDVFSGLNLQTLDNMNLNSNSSQNQKIQQNLSYNQSLQSLHNSSLSNSQNKFASLSQSQSRTSVMQSKSSLHDKDPFEALQNHEFFQKDQKVKTLNDLKDNKKSDLLKNSVSEEFQQMNFQQQNFQHIQVENDNNIQQKNAQQDQQMIDSFQEQNQSQDQQQISNENYQGDFWQNNDYTQDKQNLYNEQESQVSEQQQNYYQNNYKQNDSYEENQNNSEPSHMSQHQYSGRQSQYFQDQSQNLQQDFENQDQLNSKYQNINYNDLNNNYNYQNQNMSNLQTIQTAQKKENSKPHNLYGSKDDSEDSSDFLW